jgi:hypothetical protein
MYTLASCGKDARGGCTPGLIVGEEGEFTDPTHDIILANGMFVTWPAGMLGAKSCEML